MFCAPGRRANTKTRAQKRFAPNGRLPTRFGRASARTNRSAAERRKSRSKDQNAHRTTRWRFAWAGWLGAVPIVQIQEQRADGRRPGAVIQISFIQQRNLDQNINVMLPDSS